MMNKFLSTTLIGAALLLTLNVSAQDAQPAPPRSWHAMDFKTDGFYGISLAPAYQFVAGKKSKTVMVATIDSGVDTAQRDLQGVLWINPKEIPGNGKDDDGNGFADDVHGWDFLGGAGGKVDFNETTEEVREYNRLKDKYASVSVAPAGSEKEYAYWLTVKQQYDETIAKSKEELPQIQEFTNALMATSGYIKTALKLPADGSFTAADLVKLTDSSPQTQQSRGLWEKVFEQEPGSDNIKVLKEIAEEMAKDNNDVNPDLGARKRIVGDDPNVNDGKHYGNNVLKNADASHGTGVAGLIGAKRGNGYGIDGVADNVRIIAVKAVPNGDEYDKDIANAIHYAVDNGAKVINMSFGKKISPHKEWVDEAFKYAASKDVLLVQASGNENQDVDAKPEFPNDMYLDGSTSDNVISVGASAAKPDEHFAASFTNYGKKNVDVFAPGVKVTSIDTDAEFNTADGTSFSAPITTGIAALILEYYPDLSAKQLKQCILASATTVTGVTVFKPGSTTEKVDFASLSKTGGIVNARKALEYASKLKGERKK